MAPRWRLSDLLLLFVVLALAGGARAWYLYECVDEGQSRPLLQVQGDPPRVQLAKPEKLRGADEPTELDNIVQNVMDHRWYGGRAPLATEEELTAHVAPGYAYLLALLTERLESEKQADQWMRWIQCALGTLTAVCYFLFARRAFGNRIVACLAGVFCALHPYWIVNTAEINDGVLATFLLAATIMFGTRASQVGGALASLLFGLGLAGLVLVRAALLPFALVALLWFLLRCRKVPGGWFWSLLAVLGCGNPLAPWTVHNFQVHGEFVPIADSTFLHLWMGNASDASGQELQRADGGPMDADELQKSLPEMRLQELVKERN